MEGSNGEATSLYISTGTEAAGVPLFQNSNNANPPNTAKIGSPRMLTMNSIASDKPSTPGVPTGMTKPNNAGTSRPGAASRRPFQFGLACKTARSAITPKPTSMMASAVHLGTPGSSSLPDSRSVLTNTQL